MPAAQVVSSGDQRAGSGAGGLGTFCVLSPASRNADFVDAVEPCALTTVVGSRAHRFPFTAVLSTAFDLPHFLTAPLLSHCTAGRGNATLLVCTPNKTSGDGFNVVLNLCSHLLPGLFAAAGPSCAEIGVALKELRHSSIIDAQTIRKLMSVNDAEVTWVAQAGARVAWDAVMEKLSDRYARGASSAEESAFQIELRLPNGRAFNILDCGCSPAHLGSLTLALNSAAGVPPERKTIAPRVGLSFALEPLLPPNGLVHVMALPDASDPTYSVRVLRFTSELHATLNPLGEEDLFGAPAAMAPPASQQQPQHPPARNEVPKLVDPPSGGESTPPKTVPRGAAGALPPRSPRAGRSGALLDNGPSGASQGQQQPRAVDRSAADSWRHELTEYPDDGPAHSGHHHHHPLTDASTPPASAPPGGRSTHLANVSTIDRASAAASTSRVASAAGSRIAVNPVAGRSVRDDSTVSSPSSSGSESGGDVHGSGFMSLHTEQRDPRDIPFGRGGGSAAARAPAPRETMTGATGSPPRGRLASSYLEPTPESPAAIPRPSPRAERARHAPAGSGTNAERSRGAPGHDGGEMDRMRARLSEVERDALAAKRTSEAFEAELLRARRANEELSSALEDAHREKEALRLAAKAAQDEGHEMSDLLRKLSARLSELQDASKAHRDDTNGLRSAAEEASRENQHLKRELHDAKKTLRIMETRERDRVRNAALLRAGGGSAPSPDNKAGRASAAASSHAPSRSASVGTAGAAKRGTATPQETAAKRRIHELTSENAKLNLRIESLTAELNQTRHAVADSEVANFNAGRSHFHHHRNDGSTASAAASRASNDGRGGGGGGGSDTAEISSLRSEIEMLRAQLTSATAELDVANEERASLQRVVVGHPRGGTSSDVLTSSCQSLLRGLELLLTRLRADVSAANALNDQSVAQRQRQEQRSAHIASVEKLKASIVSVAQKDPVGFIPASAGESDAPSISLIMKAEIERLAHVKALLTPFAQLCHQVNNAGSSPGRSGRDDTPQF